ncbi:hypothetical protein L284_04270 [Novosphingobium lindaniclasticum LE124]|uniref:Uncharacterized protein n=1 Tax=Novosphingobium lindaniclasticum LE124 TaxID=1096930 RepID=T0I2C0_9SPHN|nr:hypothetical protein L284_04270 [Novosphingobium lindaniclasticum LE124]
MIRDRCQVFGRKIASKARLCQRSRITPGTDEDL